MKSKISHARSFIRHFKGILFILSADSALKFFPAEQKSERFSPCVGTAGSGFKNFQFGIRLKNERQVPILRLFEPEIFLSCPLPALLTPD